MLTDHPLSTFIKTEEEEEEEGEGVKQEVESDKLPEVKKEEEEVVLTEKMQTEENKQ